MTKNKVSSSSFQVIKTYTRFGTPSQNCARYGICKVLEVVGVVPEGVIFDNAAFGSVQITERSKLLFRFQKNSLSSKALQKYFFDSRFLIMESLELKGNMTELLGASKITIEAGLYPVQSSRNFLEMEVDSNIKLLEEISQSITHTVNEQLLQKNQKRIFAGNFCACCEDIS